tara:strand:+ start:252 stop:695 length:444 start_codon:yes stop_codon:yes gene_type:complete
MKVKSFRGRLADGSQDTIILHTNNGSTGYKITKFEIMTEEPFGGANAEHIIKIYKVEQTSVTADINFSQNTLLGAAIINNSTAGYQNASVPSVIFDNEVFNQDIYITHVDNQGSQACNYYIELEQMKLDLSENTVATLKDIRNIESQ